MDTRETFEYPLPCLMVSTDTITIETKGVYEGQFQVRNTGGSMLTGRILSRARSISFEPSEWRGNEATITYRFNPDAMDGWKPGDTLHTNAVILSNGGEQSIEMIIKLTQIVIKTDENITITSVADFFAYALKYPAQARRLFVDHAFYELLLATGYGYTDAYELLLKDMNRERALDNFFILSGLKGKTGITLPQRIVEFSRRPDDNDMLYGNFLVQKNDEGYFEAAVTTDGGAPWLSLSSERLINADFNEANTAMVKFGIDPLQIKGRYAREKIVIRERGSETTTDPARTVELVYKRLAPLTVRLNKESFCFSDAGFISINNQSGADIVLEVFCQDSFVRFEARKYFVGEQYKIPFVIKMTRLQSAQLLFRKYPYLFSEIEVKTVYHDTVIKTRLPLTVGEW